MRNVFTSKAAVIAVISGLAYGTPATADYVPYLSQERDSVDRFFNLTSILQFFGILTEVSNGAGKLQSSAIAPASDVPDSTQNLGTSERARGQMNRALDDLENDFNRHLTR